MTSRHGRTWSRWANLFANEGYSSILLEIDPSVIKTPPKSSQALLDLLETGEKLSQFRNFLDLTFNSNFPPYRSDCPSRQIGFPFPSPPNFYVAIDSPRSDIRFFSPALGPSPPLPSSPTSSPHPLSLAIQSDNTIKRIRLRTALQSGCHGIDRGTTGGTITG